MGTLRAERVERVADMVKTIEIEGAEEGELLVISWGSNVGKVAEAVAKLRAEGKSVAHTTIALVNPLQRGIVEAMAHYERILVCESNSGQLASLLRAATSHADIRSIASMEAQPFNVAELTAKINLNLE